MNSISQNGSVYRNPTNVYGTRRPPDDVPEYNPKDGYIDLTIYNFVAVPAGSTTDQSLANNADWTLINPDRPFRSFEDAERFTMNEYGKGCYQV